MPVIALCCIPHRPRHIRDLIAMSATKLDFVPAGVSGDATRPDNIVYDVKPQAGQMPGQRQRMGTRRVHRAATSIAATLPAVR
jgi:hypothetical protein